MADWEIKVQGEDSEIESENEETQDFENEFEENPEESEPLENILQGVPSRPVFQFNRQRVSPFLESNSAEDLEQGVREIPEKKEDSDKTKLPETPILYNAPKYSSNYEKGDYENMKNIDKEMDISGGSLRTRETTLADSAMHIVQQRRMDINAWQQQNMDRFDSDSEKYQVRKPDRFKGQEDLPFQTKNEPRGFG